MVAKISRKIMLSMMVLIMSLLLIPRSFAFMPVFDVTSFLKLCAEYNKLKEQCTAVEQHLKVARKQFDMAERIKNDSEGHYKFGSLLNDLTSLNKRKWAASTWSGALSGGHSSFVTGFDKLQNQYDSEQGVIQSDDYEKLTNSRRKKEYDNQINTNKTVSVNTSYAYNNINKHLQDIHKISQNIEKATNTKAAIDLNSRLLTEIAYVQIQSLRMQILMNQQIAQQAADQIKEESMTARLNDDH